MTRLPRGPLLVVLLGACAAPREREERAATDRDQVAAALYAQLDAVLARRDAIASDAGEEAARERSELDRLAEEIAERIVRVDPGADTADLARRLDRAPR